MLLTNPAVADRLSENARTVGGVITDPVLRSAQGAALLGRDVAREANILAFNDLFLLIGILACLLPRGRRAGQHRDPPVTREQHLVAVQDQPPERGLLRRHAGAKEGQPAP